MSNRYNQISRRHRTTVAEMLLAAEASGVDSDGRSRLRRALWEGWREVMLIRLRANILCESLERNQRRPRT